MIDSHHHFWDPSRGDYGWMSSDDLVLNRTYGPSDLLPHLDEVGINSTILVQAAASIEETDYLLDISDSASFVSKVVGWIDMEDESSGDILRRFCAHPKFVGVRPMIQDIPDDDWMLRDDIQWAFDLITELNLTFDCLGFPRHIDNFRKLLSRHSGMRVVLDHCLKPEINGDDDSFGVWSSGLELLAHETNAYCKLSGLVTECPTVPSVFDLRRYTDHILGVFGVERVMWGSDWPVCRLRCEYNDWYDISRDLVSDLSLDECSYIFGLSASRFYGV